MMDEVKAMPYQRIFRRYEFKYKITREQKERLLDAMAPFMELDEYGRAQIQNIYYDTPNYRLIRRSIEKPEYKEKLRVRSYGGQQVYVELKKKYKKVVYKRRLQMSEAEAAAFLSGKGEPDSQIGREIRYFSEYYAPLRPALYLSYERQAYYCKAGGDLRITFDDNILCRESELTFAVPPSGERLLEEPWVLMEIKTGSGMPLWLSALLSRERIYKTSFSKYGTAYQNIIYPLIKGEKDNELICRTF